MRERNREFVSGRWSWVRVANGKKMFACCSFSILHVLHSKRCRERCWWPPTPSCLTLTSWTRTSCRRGQINLVWWSTWIQSCLLPSTMTSLPWDTTHAASENIIYHCVEFSYHFIALLETEETGLLLSHTFTPPPTRKTTHQLIFFLNIFYRAHMHMHICLLSKILRKLGQWHKPISISETVDCILWIAESMHA